MRVLPRLAPLTITKQIKPLLAMLTKHALKSKTVWVQIAAVVSAMLPVAGDWLRSNPVEFVAALAALNVLVRFVTHGKVTVFSDDSSGHGGGALPVVSVMVR